MKRLDKQIIRYISANPGVNGTAVSAQFKISQSSTSRILRDLSTRGEIIKGGSTRSSAYFLDRISAHLAIDIEKRANAHYRPDTFEILKESGFTRDELSQMRGAGSVDQELSTRSIQAYQQFILDLSFHSSKLEGNLYTYVDTQALLNYGEYAKDKLQSDGTMILNHKSALEYVFGNLEIIGTNLETAQDIHSLLSQNLPGITLEERGACRTRMVNMNGSTFIPLNNPHEIPLELGRLISICNEIEDPINQSIYLLSAIPYLQAFVDVNKRVGRLMCSVPLIKSGLAPFSFSTINKADYTKGILSVYELQDNALLKKAYMASYLESAPSFMKTLGSMDQVNPLALKYRSEFQSREL